VWGLVEKKDLCPPACLRFLHPLRLQEARGYVKAKDLIDSNLIAQDDSENRTLQKSIEIARGILEKK
jgi:hypothetical protein